ncbi:sterol-binding protein [Chitiniphilus purpureus]|uniref:Ubiquinone biosynthesis accessory factor UbiJ n=1 Tax=Chitiniphilus purpureus TaxID=2981137 RepID=A0ABY6DPR6_9NEIS|nr:SCP2 sterol-binding domain-containing protein [Chitiniphilus sp. CD1]UXY16375.1 sterol-binding protein [Chitiniphilus sp. CD1]
MLARLINRLLANDAATAAELARHAGRVLRLSFPALSDTLVITAQGHFAETRSPAEATLEVPLAFFIAFVFDRHSAQRQLHLEGDAELAASVGRALGGLRWDLAEELSQLVGDVAANRLVWLAGRIGGIPGAIGARMAQHLVEYWRDEAALLANAAGVNRYCTEVDRLRDDVARLEKRIDLLTKKPS